MKRSLNQTLLGCILRVMPLSLKPNFEPLLFSNSFNILILELDSDWVVKINLLEPNIHMVSLT